MRARSAPICPAVATAGVAGGPEIGGSCTSSADVCLDGTCGLDQNIYSATITP